MKPPVVPSTFVPNQASSPTTTGYDGGTEPPPTPTPIAKGDVGVTIWGQWRTQPFRESAGSLPRNVRDGEESLGLWKTCNTPKGNDRGKGEEKDLATSPGSGPEVYSRGREEEEEEGAPNGEARQREWSKMRNSDKRSTFMSQRPCKSQGKWGSFWAMDTAVKLALTTTCRLQTQEER